MIVRRENIRNGDVSVKWYQYGMKTMQKIQLLRETNGSPYNGSYVRG